MEEKKFETGNIYMSCGIRDRYFLQLDYEDSAFGPKFLFSRFIEYSLGRFLDADWGEIDPEVKKLNDEALDSGEGRLMAVYKYEITGEKICIITESDRSATTILFPSEY